MKRLLHPVRAAGERAGVGVGQGTHGELGDGADANSFHAAVQVQFPRGVRIAFLPQDANPYDSGLAVDTRGRRGAGG